MHYFYHFSRAKPKLPPMNDTYKPVACAFYDQLEYLAMKKQIILIEYTDHHGEHSSPVIIQDFITRKKEEFLITTSHIEIRLDKITRINGQEPESYC